MAGGVGAVDLSMGEPKKIVRVTTMRVKTISCRERFWKLRITIACICKLSISPMPSWKLENIADFFRKSAIFFFVKT
jgi:hypothetical protein